MAITIEKCYEQTTWDRVGRQTNTDHPEYSPQNVFWPVHATPENTGANLSIIASLKGQPVGRLQRRGKCLLEVSVALGQRRSGVGTALVEFAVEDAKEHGLEHVHVITIDEADEVLTGFFDHLGFVRYATFSMLADLAEPIPAATLAQCQRLLSQGFKSRVLDKDVAADLALVIQLQARYFPGYPGFMSEAEMVRLVLERGQIAMVLEQGSQVAGFIIGGIDTTMQNGRFVRCEGYGLLGSIATSEEFRKMGVASTIMCEFVKLLKERGINHMLYGGCGPEGNASRRVAQSVGAVQEVRHFNFVKEVN